MESKTMEQLDLEYLQTLRMIKPYITCIMDNRYIELIKMWLEKLSDERFTDKTLRNTYLLKLGKQIELGVLNEPFSSAPPEGDLECASYGGFQTYHVPGFETKEKKKSKIKRKRRRWFDVPKSRSKRGVQEASDDSSWLDLTEENLSGMASGDAGNTINDSCMNEEKIGNLMHVIEQLRLENLALNQIVDKFSKEIQNGGSSKDINRLVDEVEILKARLHELLDLKQALQTSHFSVTTEWQNTISSLHKKLTAMHRKNVELKNVINTMQVRLTESDQTTGPQRCVILSEMHKKEVELVKQKHRQDLEALEAKCCQNLDDKRFEYEQKFENLRSWYEDKLQTIQEETERSTRIYYEKQLNELQTEYESDMKLIYQRRIAEATEEKCRELESFYDEKYSKLESAKDEQLKDYYGAKVEEMRAEQEKEIRFKDQEIDRLEQLLQDQCGRMQHEVQVIRDQLDNGANGDDEQVAFLQKCIVKMDKLYKKAEKEFIRQVSRMKREMDIRDKHNTIQMTTQRVKLVSSQSVVKQREIDEIVAKLEEHYKMLLMEQQSEAMREKRNDLRTIALLREQLALQ